MNKKMMVGYISCRDYNPVEKFRFIEASFTRRISSRSDRAYSKIFSRPVDYSEIVENARMMKENPTLIIVREPFLLDDELRDKVVKWVAWANNADPKEYDPFAQ